MDIIIGTVALAAVFFVIWKAWQSRFKSTGTGGGRPSEAENTGKK